MKGMKLAYAARVARYYLQLLHHGLYSESCWLLESH